MFGIQLVEPGHVDWFVVKGDTAVFRFEETATDWDGLTWAATYRPRGTSITATTMTQDDDSTAEALNFACWFETGTLDEGFYSYRVSFTDPAGEPSVSGTTVMYGAVEIRNAE